MIELKCNELGFMAEPSYTASFYDILQKYDGLFDGAEKVVVEIEETPYYALQFKREKWFVVSDDRKYVTIKFTAHKAYDYHGKVESIPSALDIHRDLHSLMKRAVQMFNE